MTAKSIWNTQTVLLLVKQNWPDIIHWNISTKQTEPSRPNSKKTIKLCTEASKPNPLNRLNHPKQTEQNQMFGTATKHSDTPTSIVIWNVTSWNSLIQTALQPNRQYQTATTSKPSAQQTAGTKLQTSWIVVVSSEEQIKLRSSKSPRKKKRKECFTSRVCESMKMRPNFFTRIPNLVYIVLDNHCVRKGKPQSLTCIDLSLCHCELMWPQSANFSTKFPSLSNTSSSSSFLFSCLPPFSLHSSVCSWAGQPWNKAQQPLQPFAIVVPGTCNVRHLVLIRPQQSNCFTRTPDLVYTGSSSSP